VKMLSTYLVVIILFSIQFSPIIAQADPCSIDGVIATFEAATMSNSIDVWLQQYQASDCSRRVISAVQILARGANTLYGNALVLDGAMYFDGLNDVVEIPHSAQLPLVDTSLTVEAWIRAASFANDRTILGEWDTSVNGTNERLHLIIRDRRPYLGFSYNDLCSQQSLQENNWYHIVWSYQLQNGTMTIFINGQPDGSATGRHSLNQVRDLRIGSRWSGNYFHGQIAELRIWNYAHTQDEIAATMNSPLRGDEPGLVAYYPLDDVEDGIAEDLVGGNDGIVHR